jgi:hypothetical protein
MAVPLNEIDLTTTCYPNSGVKVEIKGRGTITVEGHDDTLIDAVATAMTIFTGKYVIINELFVKRVHVLDADDVEWSWIKVRVDSA